MSWDDLSSELAEMFDDYAWRVDDMQSALEWFVSERKATERERQRQPHVANIKRKWRRANPERSLGYVERYRAKNQDKVRTWQKLAKQRAKERDPEKYRAQRRAQEKRYRERNAERLRALDRERKRVLRARKKAANDNQQAAKGRAA